VASQLDEIRRLREQLAEAETRAEQLRAERDQARQDHAELAGLTQRYVDIVNQPGEQPEHARQLARYQQGWLDAERHIDELHRDGKPHDEHGRMNPLEVPKELPEPKSADELIAEADAWSRREAQWWFDEYEQEQRARIADTKQREEKAELLRHRLAEDQREARPRAHDREMAS